MMYGMDLSHYQDNIDLSKGNYDFCIIKATEGIGYTDKSFDKFAEQLTKLDKLIGCYHYARPDLHGYITSMREEANWFVEEVKRMNLLGKAILILDWEKEPMDNEELVSAWCDKVFRETGVRPFIYGSASKINKWANAGWDVLKDHPIWIAKWPDGKRFEVGEELELIHPKGTWTIWQYSAVGLYPDFQGNVDLDLTKLSRDAWMVCAGNTPYKPEETITQTMQWCIDKGIFVGDGEGHYMPNNPLTREQAAQVIYNIFNIINMKDLLNEQNLMRYKSVLNSLYGQQYINTEKEGDK